MKFAGSQISTFVEDKAKAPDVAWSENTDFIALASIASPDIIFLLNQKYEPPL